MSTRYYDRNGINITLLKWRELQEDPSYCQVRQFDNGKIRLDLFWVGHVKNAQNYMQSYMPVFKIHCWNQLLTYEGEEYGWAEDPSLHGSTYATEKEAVLAYEVFLENWTASQYEIDRKTGNKVFVEADNKLTPPPPPDPDAPTIADLGASDCDDIGAW